MPSRKNVRDFHLVDGMRQMDYKCASLAQDPQDLAGLVPYMIAFENGWITTNYFGNDIFRTDKQTAQKQNNSSKNWVNPSRLRSRA